MKNKLAMLVCAIGIATACNSNNPYSPEQFLSKGEQAQVLLSTIRYFGHLPKNGTHENKFEPKFDEYYSLLAADFTLEAYVREDGYEYFMVSRLAPSIKEKKVATGVKMQRDAEGNLTYYEEVFRTWKFEIPELQEKGLMLFGKMVKGEDLSPYLPQNSESEEFIEFPDGRVFYDTGSRKWQVGAISSDV